MKTIVRKDFLSWARKTQSREDRIVIPDSTKL